MDTSHYLLIGGGSMEQAPAYIRLVSGDDNDTFIDVRYEDIGKFLASSGAGSESPDQSTVRLTRSDVPIFDGPSYDHSYVGVVQAAGVYTIVEEQTDNEGNVWGKLKSGAGWVDMAKAHSEEGARPPVTAMFATEDMLRGKDYHEYLSGSSDHAVKLIFSANEVLTDVCFASLQYENETYVILEELDTVAELRPETPFVAEVVFYGDMSSYGLLFKDNSGAARNYAIYISARNGALILEEY